MGGINLVVDNTATASQQCYISTSGPTLVQLRIRGRTVTVLGAGTFLTNGELARAGNAALAVNLLPSRRVVWLVPPVSSVAAAPGPAGPRSFASLVPLTAYLVVAQLAIAVLLAAIWRARRLGQLVTEPLPVVVRASETVEGHGHLYQSRHARGRAASALRAAALIRISKAAGLPPGASRETVTAAVAARTAADQATIAQLLYGPAPRTDQALVNLAREVDELEREVGRT
jgi:hypothetical protein